MHKHTKLFFILLSVFPTLLLAGPLEAERNFFNIIYGVLFIIILTALVAMIKASTSKVGLPELEDNDEYMHLFYLKKVFIITLALSVIVPIFISLASYLFRFRLNYLTVLLNLPHLLLLLGLYKYAPSHKKIYLAVVGAFVLYLLFSLFSVQIFISIIFWYIPYLVIIGLAIMNTQEVQYRVLLGVAGFISLYPLFVFGFNELTSDSLSYIIYYGFLVIMINNINSKLFHLQLLHKKR